MNTAIKAIAGIVIIAVASIAGYMGWAAKQKKDQQQAVARLVSDSTEQLKVALAKPTPELAAQLDANLQAVKAPRDRAFADAAEHYILGAREIARRRADAARLSAEAAAGRRALADHMQHRARGANWYGDAMKLKTRVEQQHADLGRTLKALEELLITMPESEKRLAPHVSANLMLEAGVRENARKQAQEEAQAANAELEKARQLIPR